MYMGRWTPLTFGLGSHNLAEVSASEFVPGQDLELVHSVRDQIVQGEDGGRLGKYLQRGPLGYLSIHTTVPTYITITRLFAKSIEIISLSKYSIATDSVVFLNLLLVYQ